MINAAIVAETAYGSTPNCSDIEGIELQLTMNIEYVIYIYNMYKHIEYIYLPKHPLKAHDKEAILQSTDEIYYQYMHILMVITDLCWNIIWNLL